MSLIAVWYLLIYLPNESAGRQVGPFATEAQCRIAESSYNERLRPRFSGPQSACFQGAAK